MHNHTPHPEKIRAKGVDDWAIITYYVLYQHSVP